MTRLTALLLAMCSVAVAWGASDATGVANAAGMPPVDVLPPIC